MSDSNDVLQALNNEKKWVFPEHNLAEIPAEVLETQNLSPVLAGMLFRRGLKNTQELKSFFKPSLEMLHDPFLMKDMDLAVRRITQALEDGEKIMVLGDYDVDGTTATALVFKILSAHSPNISHYIPDRYKEGYGISFAGIDHAASIGASLIIALDCGVKALDKVAYAKDKNIGFIICDHHLPGSELPLADAILDPKRADCPYPFKELSGCGVGFKLMQALSFSLGWDENFLIESLDLVAVSIASDIVPVSGENRVLLHAGLEKINTAASPGLQALMDIAGLKREGNGQYNLKVERLVFGIGPRINAAGRIGHGTGAVKLLLAKNEEEANEFAKAIDTQNTERKELDRNITLEALELIESSEESRNAFSTVLFKDTWHKGVIGIVASRCIEKFHRPTVILTLSDGKLVGSARSVHGFDLYTAIDACSEHLIQFGGHYHAAGLTMLPEKLDSFRLAFENQVRSRMSREDLQPRLEVDALMEPSDLNGTFFRWVDRMGPFGPDNMNPMFVMKGVRNSGQSRLLDNKSGGPGHIKFSITHESLQHEGQNYVLEGIGFSMGESWHLLESGSKFDLAFHLEENNFRDKKSIQLTVKEIRPSES